MSCPIQKFRDDKIKEARNEVYNPKAVAYRTFKDNSIIITPTNGSKIKSVDQAFKAAEAMEKKIAKKYGKEFNFEVYGKWTTIYKSPSDVRLEITIPPNLLRAYEVKNKMKETPYYNEPTASVEQKKKDTWTLFDMPKGAIDNQVNFDAYIDHKQSLITKFKSKLYNLNVLKKFEGKENEAEIRRLDNLIEKLEEDIAVIKNPDTVFSQIVSFIGEEMLLVDTLLANPTIENLNTAREILSYLDAISDYGHENKEDNPFLNQALVWGIDGNNILDENIKDALKTISQDVKERVSDLSKAKEKYLQKLVNDSSQIKEMLRQQGKDELEIEELLAPLEDIDKISKQLLTIDKQFYSQDSLLAQLMKIELEIERSIKKSKVQGFIERLNAAEKELVKAGTMARDFVVNNWFNGAPSTINFDPFYQKDINGSSTGRLVNKFTSNWNKMSVAFERDYKRKNAAFYAKKEYVKIDKNNARKFSWIDSNAHIIDVTKLPEVVNHPAFAQEVGDVDQKESEAYEKELIELLGQNKYEEVVEEQLNQLLEYEKWKYRIVKKAFKEEGVFKFEDLPAKERASIRIKVLKKSPFELSKSKNSNQKGKVDYVSGNSSKQYQSSMDYNTYVPRKEISVIKNGNLESVDSNYYDKNFEKIEANDAAYKYWKVLEESYEYINHTLVDSENKLTHGSIPAMRKEFSDFVFKRKGWGVNMSAWIREGFKTKRKNSNASEFQGVNKAQFSSMEEKVAKKTRLRTLQIQNKYKETLPSHLNLYAAPQSLLDTISEVIGSSSNRQELIDTFPNNPLILMTDFIGMHIQDQVIEQGVTNLSVMTRAYLEMTAEYAAQRDAQPVVSLMKEFYDRIKKGLPPTSTKELVLQAENRKKQEANIGLERVRAKQRLNFWYNKNVKGVTDKDSKFNFGKPSYTAEEKEWMETLKESLKNDPNLSDVQKAAIQKEMDNLGSTWNSREIYNTVFNVFPLFAGLAWKVPSAAINRLQGWAQAEILAGHFYTSEDFNEANHFVMKKFSRIANRGEVSKVKLLVNIINILQDATNEIDRARNTSGKVGMGKKLSPYYLTEYAEWNNQVPQILAVLRRKMITDKNGNEVPIFDGKGLPAFEIVDGLLKLKPEFAEVPGNVETWQNFSNRDAGSNKLFMSEMIAITQGDYSKTGGTLIKSNVFGKTVMLFKTWMANQVYNRIHSEQTNLITGNIGSKGIYSSHNRTTPSTVLATSGFMAFGPVGAAVGLSIGIVGGSLIRNASYGDVYNMVDIKKSAAILGATFTKMAGLPLNAITGKQTISSVDLKKYAALNSNGEVNQEDAKNLNSIVTELSVLLSFTLFKILLNSIKSSNDEDELMEMDGAVNPYYKEKNELRKSVDTYLENEISGVLESLVSIQNPIEYSLNLYKGMIALRQLEKIVKFADASHKYLKGEDMLLGGTNSGESGIMNATKAFLPSMFPTTKADRDFDPEWINEYFHTDYKKAKKKLTRQRGELRAKLEKETEKFYDYKNQDLQTKIWMRKQIDSEVEDAVDAFYPTDIRSQYDWKQEALKNEEDRKEE